MTSLAMVGPITLTAEPPPAASGSESSAALLRPCTWQPRSLAPRAISPPLIVWPPAARDLFGFAATRRDLPLYSAGLGWDAGCTAASSPDGGRRDRRVKRSR